MIMLAVSNLAYLALTYTVPNIFNSVVFSKWGNASIQALNHMVWCKFEEYTTLIQETMSVRLASLLLCALILFPMYLFGMCANV